MTREEVIDKHGVPLAWGLLAALVLLFVVGLVVPLTGAYLERAERIEDDYARLSKLESIARLRPEALRKQEAAVDRALEKFVFSGKKDPDRLVLELRKKMESLAQDFSVRLQSIETGSSGREDDIQSVVLRISAEAEPAGAISLLESLRTNSPLIAVDDVLLYAGSTRRRGRNAKAEDPLNQPLSLSFTLEAFLAPRG